MTVAATAAVPGLRPVDDALALLGRRRGATATRGLLPGWIVPERTPGWVPASALVSGARLDDLLDAAKQRWGATPHAGAALAWRSYTYWLAMPAVLGWATARRVPLLHPDDVLVHFVDHEPFLTIGLRRARLSVLPDDPLAADGDPDVTVVSSEHGLLAVLRDTLRGTHLDPLLAQIQSRVNLGSRTLLGSLASAVAYGLVRGLDPTATDVAGAADTLLSTLDLADLVALQPGPDGHLSVLRRTCCLAFTLPEPKICSGCCIRAEPTPAI